MALTADQVYLLNTITYMSEPGLHTATEGMDVGSYVNAILNNRSLREQMAEKDFMTADQLLTVCQQIKNDPALCEMTIAHASRTEGGADRLIFVSPDSQQAVIALEGTVGACEWRDDAYGAGETTAYGTRDGVSTPGQETEMDWFQSPEVQSALEGCDHVTISGHSKGGNKAKYLTLLDESGVIDECISFDGQGFSDEFIQHYEDQIRANQDKIVNYNNENDYVNILLNDVGEKHYIEGEHVDNPMAHHSLFTMRHSIPMSEHEAHQSELMREADQLFNSYLRTLSSEDKVLFGKMLGELLAATVGGDGWEAAGNLLEILLGEGGLGLFKDFLEYAFAYASAELAEALLKYLREKFPELAPWLDALIAKIEKKEGMPDGSDLRVSGADVIRIDTAYLNSISSQLRSLGSTVSSYAGSVNRCATMCDDFNIFIKMGLRLSLVFSKGLAGILDGTPAQVLRGLDKDMRKLSDDVAQLSANLLKAAEAFEQNEKDIIAAMPSTEGIISPWA